MTDFLRGSAIWCSAAQEGAIPRRYENMKQGTLPNAAQYLHVNHAPIDFSTRRLSSMNDLGLTPSRSAAATESCPSIILMTPSMPLERNPVRP
ncbi:hypothetical protein [Sphingomonas sp. 66-10]|uniref:hypothetical protein n=1 Tax=Sphingomonas sp. 66-10 TaxID=1895848 RepID=UPI0025797769|nr:hypothetical protein [Sphingomonas sp. 66-10]